MQYDSGWKEGDVGHVTPIRLVEYGKWLLMYLQETGIRMPLRNRLANAMALISDTARDKAGILRRDPVLLDRIEAAQATLMNAALVSAAVQGLPQERREHLFHPDMLACFLRGAESPRGERESRARNTEFELLTAARLLLGDLGVLRVAAGGNRQEPDMRFRAGVLEYALEAKRLVSTREQTLRSRIREASNQILASRMTGYVALNLDAWTEGIETRGSPAEFGTAFTKRVRSAHAQLATQDQKMHLAGAIIFADILQWDFEDQAAGVPVLRTVAGIQAFSFAGSEQEMARLRGFFEPWYKRLNIRVSRLFPPSRPVWFADKVMAYLEVEGFKVERISSGKFETPVPAGTALEAGIGAAWIDQQNSFPLAYVIEPGGDAGLLAQVTIYDAYRLSPLAHESHRRAVGTLNARGTYRELQFADLDPHTAQPTERNLKSILAGILKDLQD